MGLDQLTSALSDRYVIESEIDTGGMATVYRARDLKHDRTVAIKVLRPDLAEAIGADRFLKEIRTTANLSHPHILPLFDSGEADGFLYYVMPFVKGESLADRLEQEGQLPVEDAIQIAREVADALAYAHRNGVIHRDIKPANVMLDEGHALLMDFGIAQAQAGADETRLTGMGMSLGTPAYMSPEQISGQGKVEGRSDQYALACVLYEMLAGHPPFTAENVQTVMRQHLAAVAPKVTGARTSVPTGVAKAIHRGLAKSPADRYRTVAEFERALAGATLPLLGRIPLGRARAMAYGVTGVLALAAAGLVGSLLRPEVETGPPPDPALVAIAPFRNDTGDPTYDLLSSQAAENVQHFLELRGVAQAVSRTVLEPILLSAEPSQDTVAFLSRRLGAGIVVTGRLVLLGDSLQIRAGCFDAVAGDDFFPVQPVTVPKSSPELALQQIPDRVVAVIAQFLDPGNPFEAFESPPRVLDAYREFRRASEMAAQGGSQDEVIAHYLRASELDSTYLVPLLDVADQLRTAGRLEEMDSVLAVLENRRQLMTPLQLLFFDYTRLGIEGELELAQLKVREIAKTHPTEIAYNQGIEALNLNYLDEAAAALERWETPEGGFREEFVSIQPLYFNVYPIVLHLLGRHQKELAVVLEGRRRFPAMFGLRDREVEARAASGDMENLDSLVALSRSTGGGASLFRIWAAADELRAHGFREEAGTILEEEFRQFDSHPIYSDTVHPYRGPHTRAHILHRLGREAEAHALWEEALPHVPLDHEAVGLLGVTAAHAGDTAQARELLDRLSRIPDPDALARAAQYRAWIAVALGEYEQAVRFLGQLPPLNGYRGLYLHRDINLEPLRGYPAFDAFMRSKG